MTITAEDVARIAGVSVSTVSRALSSPERVATRTRERVLRVAEELRYRPNRAARTLATGRVNLIGVVVPDLQNPYFSSLTKAIQTSVQMAGRQALIFDSDEDQARESEILKSSLGALDGLVLCSPRVGDAEVIESTHLMRVVTINREVPGVPGVLVDYSTGIQQAMRHLAALGHREIAYVGGPLTSWADKQRRTGFSHPDLDGTVNRHDIGAFPPYFSSGVAAADLVLATPATAVIVFNDLMALGLLDRVKSRGVRVPEELSIISFDNSMLATFVTPRLTSIAFSGRTVARKALDLLFSGESDDSTEAAGEIHQLCPTELTVRASVGPVPTA